jgi:hypothetical protein
VPEDASVRLVGPDPCVVEAALLRYPKGLTREALACGLGWTLDRLDRALEQLAEGTTTSGGGWVELRGIVTASRHGAQP